MADSTRQKVTANIMLKSAPDFSQVVFRDIPHLYPPSTPITCSYTLAAPFQPHSRDWVGIFKVGWSTTKDYHTFVWVEPSGGAGQQAADRQAYFKDYYLPKDDADFYQFCYVDSSGQVCGASTPFCFKTATEQSAECTLDNDLLVVTTQEQVDRSLREKAALKAAGDRLQEKNDDLQKALQEERRQVGVLEEQWQRQSEEMSEMARELGEVKDQKKRLEDTLQQQQQQEMLAQQMQIQQGNPAESTQSSDGGGEAGLLRQTELQLREAQAVIADKEATMEEKDRLILMMKRQNVDLAQENRILRNDVEELRRTLEDLRQVPPPDGLAQSEAADTREPLCDSVPEGEGDTGSFTQDHDKDEPAPSSCCHCLEIFPGLTRAELELHERSHQVCPFCTLICDNMAQSVFEDHVYSHEM